MVALDMRQTRRSALKEQSIGRVFEVGPDRLLNTVVHAPHFCWQRVSQSEKLSRPSLHACAEYLTFL